MEIKQCKYCGKPFKVKGFGILTPLSRRAMGQVGSHREGYCSTGCSARAQVENDPIKSFLVPLGMILGGFLVFMILIVLEKPDPNDFRLNPIGSIGLVVAVFGFLLLCIVTYNYLTVRKNPRLEKPKQKKYIIESFNDKSVRISKDDFEKGFFKTVIEIMEAGNYQVALLRLNRLEKNQLITSEGKLTTKLLTIQCLFQLKEYTKAYLDIREIFSSHNYKQKLAVEDYILKFLCEKQLDMSEEGLNTLKKAMELFPDHPKLNIVLQNSDSEGYRRK